MIYLFSMAIFDSYVPEGMLYAYRCIQYTIKTNSILNFGNIEPFIFQSNVQNATTDHTLAMICNGLQGFPSSPKKNTTSPHVDTRSDSLIRKSSNRFTQQIQRPLRPRIFSEFVATKYSHCGLLHFKRADPSTLMACPNQCQIVGRGRS